MVVPKGRASGHRSREELLAGVEQHRRAADALDAAARFDSSGLVEALRRAEQEEEKARFAAARANEDVRRAAAALREVREAVRDALSPFVAEGAPPGMVAELHGVPVALVRPRADRAAADGGGGREGGAGVDGDGAVGGGGEGSVRVTAEVVG